eukprot:253419-Chlamydomonas_euryale.AAC.6
MLDAAGQQRSPADVCDRQVQYVQRVQKAALLAARFILCTVAGRCRRMCLMLAIRTANATIHEATECLNEHKGQHVHPQQHHMEHVLDDFQSSYVGPTHRACFMYRALSTTRDKNRFPDVSPPA